MALAPDIEALKTKKQPKNKEKLSMTEMKEVRSENYDVADDGIVDYQIICTGGMGKSVGMRYAKSNKFDTKISIIDTSGEITKSNHGIEYVRIKGLNGSGKIRAENHDEIKDFMSGYIAEMRFDDVNVIVVSMAGGSGSVISPMMLNEILRQKKVPIIIGIIDTSSQIDCVNSLNGLKSLANIARNHKAYIPTILFDNDHGKNVVDSGIDKILAYISEILRQPYKSIDKMDRLTFLQPQAFDGVDTGIKMLNISKGKDGDWEDGLGLVVPEESYQLLDSTMIICSVDDHVQLAVKSISIYNGYYDGKGLENIVASIGYEVPADLISKLNNEIHQFKSMTVRKKTEIELEYDDLGSETDDGLVL